MDEHRQRQGNRHPKEPSQLPTAKRQKGHTNTKQTMAKSDDHRYPNADDIYGEN